MPVQAAQGAGSSEPLGTRREQKEKRMSRQADIATLRRYSVLAWSASLLVVAFGAVSLLLFAHPSLIGVDPPSAATYQGSPAWLVFGALFIILGITLASVAFRWPRHLLRILKTGQTRPMRLRVGVEHGSESTQYYALLSDVSHSPDSPRWRIGLWAPSDGTRALVGQDLVTTVYVDPDTGQPTVVEYSAGYLWAMKGAIAALQEAPRPDA
jgi:hypothetical protein